MKWKYVAWLNILICVGILSPVAQFGCSSSCIPCEADNDCRDGQRCDLGRCVLIGMSATKACGVAAEHTADATEKVGEIPVDKSRPELGVEPRPEPQPEPKQEPATPDTMLVDNGPDEITPEPRRETPTEPMCTAGEPCKATGSKGECANGKTKCTNGKSSCEPGAPSSEVCNGKDDDCDGQVDETFLCPCSMTEVKGSPGFCIDKQDSTAPSLKDGIADCAKRGVGGKLCSVDDIDLAIKNAGISIASGRALASANSQGCCCPCGSYKGIASHFWEATGGSHGFKRGKCECWFENRSSVKTYYRCCTNLTASKCAQTTEQCNGKDDNCDGQVDENCALVLWYKFEQTSGMVVDSSGHGNHGKVIGSVNRGATGKQGKAFQFPGSNGYIETSHSSSFDFGKKSFSIDFWLNTASRKQSILNKLSGSGSQRVGIFYGFDGINLDIHVLSLGQYANVAINQLPTNQWHRITLVVDRAQNKAFSFLDGNLKTTQSIANHDSITNTIPLRIGHKSTTPAFYKGMLDELKIYRKAHYPTSINQWKAISSTGAPVKRCYHSAVWTGQQMIVWGGHQPTPSGGGNVVSPQNTGGIYDPATNSWKATSTTNAPRARLHHSAVWTGTELIVWGGIGGQGGPHLNTGGHYNPASNSWTSIPTTGAPSKRYLQAGVWTGKQLLVWGGRGSGALNDGGAYTPSQGWKNITTTNAPSARLRPAAVWTGKAMLIWGGTDSSGVPQTAGGRYDPVADKWTAMSTKNAPQARGGMVSVWTGSEFIVWGGERNNVQINTGGRYDPATDTWVPMTTVGAPVGRLQAMAVWTGQAMLVWGGVSGSPAVFHNDGALYFPSTDTWKTLSLTNAPSGRYRGTLVWTGTEAILWGGRDLSGNPLNDGGLYIP